MLFVKTWTVLTDDKEATGKFYSNLGPVVQSIVSLTKSLVNDSLSLLARLKSSELIFFAEKMRGTFCTAKAPPTAKAPLIFFGKKWQYFYV